MIFLVNLYSNILFLIGTLAVAFRETIRGAKRDGMTFAQYGMVLKINIKISI